MEETELFLTKPLDSINVGDIFKWQRTTIPTDIEITYVLSIDSVKRCKCKIYTGKTELIKYFYVIDLEMWKKSPMTYYFPIKKI